MLEQLQEIFSDSIYVSFTRNKVTGWEDLPGNEYIEPDDYLSILQFTEKYNQGDRGYFGEEDLCYRELIED